MEISRLDNEFIEKEKTKSVKNARGILSCDSYKKGWDACIQFVKKVENASHVCTQCGKLIRFDETEYDSDFTPFCKKCYEKVFENKNQTL